MPQSVLFFTIHTKYAAEDRKCTSESMAWWNNTPPLPPDKRYTDTAAKADTENATRRSQAKKAPKTSNTARRRSFKEPIQRMPKTATGSKSPPRPPSPPPVAPGPVRGSLDERRLTGLTSLFLAVASYQYNQAALAHPAFHQAP
ncbi:hypothetical protein BaRGS_00026914 [Batillaria attramentaria]|uniref:Uncharacterized protein n=1 Tax=Batillaria attramentaria TaxID=370345 RepID=A0ABD0K4T4_9CAEN